MVFVLRVLEENSTEAVAQCLIATESSVKVRLHRGREMPRLGFLQRAINSGALDSTWTIGGERCDRIVPAVFAGLGPYAIGMV